MVIKKNMESNSFCTILSIVLVGFLFNKYTHVTCNTISKSSFPQDFIFGAGSSAYQIEGAANIDRKGLSNWDYSTHKDPETTWDGSNGDISDDFYHRYKDDIKLMKKVGLTHFHFSISWSRILPRGTKAGGVNQLGINFYNNLINELLDNGIQPFVTLFHWDVPQALEQAYGGFLSPNIISDFVDFGEICFKEFGDRVKKWVTMSAPNSYVLYGYVFGYFVPNRCSKKNNGQDDSQKCHGGNSATEPYIVAHHLLLSHASLVSKYRNNYQASQNGTIGMGVACDWVKPYDKQIATLNATKRYYEHFCGWFLNPVTYGDYPKILREMVGDRLPKFTTDQSNLLKKSYDFLGLDYYTTAYVQEENSTIPHFDLDAQARKTYIGRKGKPIGSESSSPTIFYYPKGLRRVTLYMQKRYDNPVIFITANGYSTLDKPNQTYSKHFYLKDGPRVHYLKGHTNQLHKAIKSGANVKGYFVRSFFDGFEWNAGYVAKYGLIYVDRKNGLKRYMKNSAKWYGEFLHS